MASRKRIGMNPLPIDFVKRIELDRPNDHSVFLESIDREVVSSIQVNPHKSISQDWKDVLDGEVPWWTGGKFLKSRPKFSQDPLFHAGAYYSQESSSMFVGWLAKQLLKGKTNIRVLDLCAAPGGKTLLLSEVVGDDGVLFSNEINKTRNQILVENIVKWGASNVVVTLGDAAKFAKFEGYFDLILVDAPCSGEGMFRKDETAREEWSLENVMMCASRQQDILEHVLPLLGDGGHLIYSTCTFAKSENEEICEWLAAQAFMEGVKLDVPEDWNIEEVENERYKGFKFLPHKVRGEGFFTAVFQKVGGPLFRIPRVPSRPFFKPLPKKQVEGMSIGLKGFWVINPHEEIYVSPLPEDEFQLAMANLFVTLPGVEVGKRIREELIPSHHLSMIPNVHSVDRILDLTRDQALDYLAKEEIKIEAPTQGWALVSFNGVPLGWVKLLKQRVNNYYPKEWKLRFRES